MSNKPVNQYIVTYEMKEYVFIPVSASSPEDAKKIAEDALANAPSVGEFESEFVSEEIINVEQVEES